MAFKDSLRLEQIYFQKLKDTIQTLKVLNEGENTEKEQDIIEGLVEACAAILLLYRNLGEEWNELTALIQKTMHDLVDLKEQSDAYHDELNEKIDEVNNYLNAAITVIEAEINAFGGLPSNANASEGDVLTVGEDGVNEWRSPSGGLEILTLEWYTDLEQERSYYLLKDPSGEPIETLSDANEWYEKGAIIHVLSVNPESFVLNYNKTNQAVVNEETVYISPVVGRFLYPSHYEYSYLEVFSKNPIWTGYETDTRNDTVLAHIIFEYIGLRSSSLTCTNVEGTSLRLSILDEGPLGFFVDGEGSTPLTIACGYDTAIAKGINVEVFNIVQRQNFYSTCEKVNVTKFDYLSPSEVAALLESGDPTQATNTNGILVYLENGDKILGYTANNLTRGFYEDVYKYIDESITFVVSNIDDQDTTFVINGITIQPNETKTIKIHANLLYRNMYTNEYVWGYFNITYIDGLPLDNGFEATNIIPSDVSYIDLDGNSRGIIATTSSTLPKTITFDISSLK